MPRLFGRDYSQHELAQRVGRLEAVGGVTPFEYSHGKAKGVRALRVATGTGFEFVCMVDRGLDVGPAYYNGIPLSWQSRNVIVAPQYYDRAGNEFLRSFFGGLFTTCGLTNFGPGGEDRFGSFGLHGPISNTPAENVSWRQQWDGGQCSLEIHGSLRQTRVFGENMRLERTLRTSLGSNALELHDVVTNEAGSSWPHMILYHCNGGFPILSSEARLHVTHDWVTPRDAEAAKGLGEWDTGGEPQPDFKEQVFIHRPVCDATGRALVALTNSRLCGGEGLGVGVRFDPAQLPALFTWRMLGCGTYVMGMEPANCQTIEGRLEAAKRGTLPFLEPGESREYSLTFEVLSGARCSITSVL